jgi:hypothetical protein
MALSAESTIGKKVCYHSTDIRVLLCPSPPPTRKSFAAALRSNPRQQQLPVITKEVPSPTEHQQQNAGHSTQAPNVSCVFRVATVKQQIMTVQWRCIREGENSGQYENCLKPNEAKWPLDFIRPSKSQHLMRMALGGSAVNPVNSYKTNHRCGPRDTPETS